MRLIGYARISTLDQDLEAQRRALAAAGCRQIVEEKASGASRARPELIALLGRIRRGDVLVVVRIDRLARSLAHLLEVIERLRLAGAGFRSLSDPIDTSGPSGTLILQILGAVAEFERALIRERTKVGLAVARSRGKLLGNPGLRARDPETLAKIGRSRRAGRLGDLLPGLDEWLPVLRRCRPQLPWDAATERINAALPPGRRRFTKARLVSAVRLLVGEGLADAALLEPAPRSAARAEPCRAVEVAAAFVSGRPEATLAAVGRELARLRLAPPRGGSAWAPSSVKQLLDTARALGLLAPDDGAAGRQSGPEAPVPAEGSSAPQPRGAAGALGAAPDRWRKIGDGRWVLGAGQGAIELDPGVGFRCRQPGQQDLLAATLAEAKRILTPVAADE